jgi:hypothetical protein
MGVADFLHGGVGILSKAGPGIGAKEGEGFFLAELMPEVLEADRSAIEAAGPHDSDHLPEGAHETRAAAGSESRGNLGGTPQLLHRTATRAKSQVFS